MGKVYETRAEYETLLKDEVILLEWQLGHSVRHGNFGLCPRCRGEGNFDLEGLGFDSGADNSIYYSTVYGEWRCRRCDFNMCR